jgi:hypothetical protein
MTHSKTASGHQVEERSIVLVAEEGLRSAVLSLSDVMGLAPARPTVQFTPCSQRLRMVYPELPTITYGVPGTLPGTPYPELRNSTELYRAVKTVKLKFKMGKRVISREIRCPGNIVAIQKIVPFVYIKCAIQLKAKFALHR